MIDLINQYCSQEEIVVLQQLCDGKTVYQAAWNLNLDLGRAYSRVNNMRIRLKCESINYLIQVAKGFAPMPSDAKPSKKLRVAAYPRKGWLQCNNKAYRKQAKELWYQNLSIAAIARKLNTSQGHVCRLLSENY